MLDELEAIEDESEEDSDEIDSQAPTNIYKNLQLRPLNLEQLAKPPKMQTSDLGGRIPRTLQES